MSADTPTPDVRALAREVLRLDGEATPGPWLKPFDDGALTAAVRPGESLLALDVDGMAVIERGADARLIAHYRTAAPALARAVLAGEPADAAIVTPIGTSAATGVPAPLAHPLDAPAAPLDREGLARDLEMLRRGDGSFADNCRRLHAASRILTAHGLRHMGNEAADAIVFSVDDACRLAEAVASAVRPAAVLSLEERADVGRLRKAIDDGMPFRLTQVERLLAIIDRLTSPAQPTEEPRP